MKTKLTYKNNELLAITDDEKMIFKLGDFVNLDLYNNYNISGHILEITNNKFILGQGKSSTYISFDYIKRIS